MRQCFIRRSLSKMMSRGRSFTGEAPWGKVLEGRMSVPPRPPLLAEVAGLAGATLPAKAAPGKDMLA